MGLRSWGTSRKTAGEPVVDQWPEEPAEHGRAALFLSAAGPAKLVDRRHDGLAVAGGRAGPNSDRADGIESSSGGWPDRRTATQSALADRPLLPEYAAPPKTQPVPISPRFWRSPNTPMSRSRRPGARQLEPALSLSQHPLADPSHVQLAADVPGYRHHPHAVLVAAMRDDVHRKTTVARGARSRARHGPRGVQLDWLEIVTLRNRLRQKDGKTPC